MRKAVIALTTAVVAVILLLKAATMPVVIRNLTHMPRLLAHSLGTAVATELAEERAVGGVVLVAPFTSLPEAVRTRLKVVPRWLLDWERGRFDALEDMAGINTPIFMAIGTEDDLVPRENARALYAAAGLPKKWLDINGVKHNNILRHPDLFKQADRFVRETLEC